MRDRRTARGRCSGLLAALATLAVTATLAACGPAVPTATSPTPSPSPPPSVAATSLPTGEPSGGAVAVDPTLLDILPSEVDGVAVELDEATSATVAADPATTGDVEAIAIALALDTENAGGDLAIANVVRLRAGVFNDEFYRSWRDSFDEAACASAGGVVGHAEAELGGRQVFIGSCAGGARTYHVLAADRILVAVTSVGERRLGEQLVANLD